MARFTSWCNLSCIKQSWWPQLVNHHSSRHIMSQHSALKERKLIASCHFHGAGSEADLLPLHKRVFQQPPNTIRSAAVTCRAAAASRGQDLHSPANSKSACRRGILAQWVMFTQHAALLPSCYCRLLLHSTWIVATLPAAASWSLASPDISALGGLLGSLIDLGRSASAVCRG